MVSLTDAMPSPTAMEMPAAVPLPSAVPLANAHPKDAVDEANRGIDITGVKLEATPWGCSAFGTGPRAATRVRGGSLPPPTILRRRAVPAPTIHGKGARFSTGPLAMLWSPQKRPPVPGSPALHRRGAGTAVTCAMHCGRRPWGLVLAGAVRLGACRGSVAPPPPP